ncbi:uncharacterized protein (DUF342 family) [Natronospira proteinivora]|uniref:Uncharacterized protein (DUF342 family) n=1 Tax=Natronospira proteinivora TaxID=1807133 RepID=A0ABT1G5E9_9GAMM|nr:FapA family protein [Natronospira proteinivora]MCP1726531.1 uncharacterized protein (DUF342 family) [Natronospira proteinivora]
MESPSDRNTEAGDIHLTVDTEKKELLASTSQALPTMTLAQLYEVIKTGRFRHCALPESRVKAFLTKVLEGPVENFPLCDTQDGEFKLRVEDDGLKAYLRVTPSAGGDPVSLESVKEALKERDIHHGLNMDRVATIVRNADDKEHLVAEGTAPEDGAEAFFEPLVPDMIDRRPRIDDTERADFRDLGGVITVTAGQNLIRRHSPTEGTPGTDIHGLPIPPKPGKDKRFKSHAKGVELDDSDPDILRASIDGQPIWKQDTVMVSPTLDLDAVDLSTGNIDFNGTVRIRGEVKQGMRVRARDDIQVNGMVDGATLEAGGDVTIRGGVIGQRRAGRSSYNACIHCEGSVEARFLEHVEVRCGGDLMVKDLLAHCDVEAGERIIVGAQGTRKGHILGGTYEAFEIISAIQLGSPSGAETQLKVANQFRLKKTIRAIETHLASGKLSPEETEDYRERQARLNMIRRRLQEKAAIIAKEAVCTRVFMHIETASRQFTTDAGGGTYRRKLNRIEIDPNA